MLRIEMRWFEAQTDRQDRERKAARVAAEALEIIRGAARDLGVSA